ncbi:MAG: hypothetical protein H6621_12675 [Halobacteriovoraceae bacterium]|nr:hypothetical protein [Halobacteriovoraceae bacterium]MCB9095915.1 hypothetical protein [Halobacteriovoraceae bacterium]
MKFIILISLLLISCEKKLEQKVTASLKSEISTIDPQKSYDLVSNLVIYQFYETLFQYHYLKRPYTLIPLLAEKLPEISQDGLTYKIQIKKGIPYHPTDPLLKDRFVKAEDFVMGIKRMAFQGTKSNGWWLLKNKIKGLDEFREQAGEDISKLLSLKVQGLKILDETTFEIHLKSSYPQLMHVLSMAFTSPVPSEIIEKYANNLESRDFGTGPFLLQEMDVNKKVRLTKFLEYNHDFFPSSGDRESNEKNLLQDANQRLPLINELEFVVISDDDERWKKFHDHEIDFSEIPATKLHSVLNLNGKLKPDYKDQGVELQVSSSLIFWWFAFNMNDPIVGKNKYLRKAISLAIDLDKYISNFYHNTGRRANSLYPPGVVGYNPSQEFPYQHNLKLAREYLEKAGYPRGKGLPVLEFSTRRDSEKHILMAQFVKNELSKIGITVKIIVNRFTDFLTKSKAGQLQFWQGGWLMDYPDPENVLQLLYSKNANGGPNKTGFNNPQFDKLYEKLLTITEDEKKKETLKKMEEIVLEEVPWIISNYSIHYIAKNERLKNFRYSDLIFNFYKYLKKK